MKLANLTLLLLATALSLNGCTKSDGRAEKTAEGLTKIKIGYIGLTCEAPLFVAQENGFFKEEGLDIEMVKVEWAQFKDVLGLGGFHVAHQPVMMFLKPIEQGMDVKMTAGIHLGCLRVQAPLNGKIKTIADLRGKRIGVPGMGTPPFIFANRVLGDNGMDPKTDVEWKVFPSAELGLALDKGEVDAIANAEPIGSLLLAEGKVQTIADQALDKPYAGEYCCAVLMNGKYVALNPEASASATRAIMKAAKWVETNPRAAARLSILKGYIGSNPELNTQILGSLRYLPSVSKGADAVASAAISMKGVGMLSPTTDVESLSKQVFVKLEGVTDEWVDQLEVEKVAQGQVPPDQAVRVAMELMSCGGPLLAITCCPTDSAPIKK
jgi:NitT/TauT family transport system substrate-binding protein